MKPVNTVDIALFSLPNCSHGEFRFEEPRDILEVRAVFKSRPAECPGFLYLKRYWPQHRREAPQWTPMETPFAWSWTLLDDQFNAQWTKAAVDVVWEGCTAIMTFKPLSAEMEAPENYDVTYRHTLGVWVDTADPSLLDSVQIFTRSPGTVSTIIVELDAGKQTSSRKMRVLGYNAEICRITPISGSKVETGDIVFCENDKSSFEISVSHMMAPGICDGDEGQITFDMDDDTFTISLESLKREGPIWYEEMGIFIKSADDGTDYQTYREDCSKKKNISDMVMNIREQSFANAHFRQPRPHIENAGFTIGYKYARQTFRISANGDVLLDYFNVIDKCKARDTERFKNFIPPDRHVWPPNAARFFFGMERWYRVACFSDPAPVMAFNVHSRKDGVMLEQKCIAVPLMHDVMENDMQSDDAMVALLRFRFINTNDWKTKAVLPVGYSQHVKRTDIMGIAKKDRYTEQDDYLIPFCKRDELKTKGNGIYSSYLGEDVLRCLYQADVKAGTAKDGGVAFSMDLKPREIFDIYLKIPFIALETEAEFKALKHLDFDACYEKIIRYWREVGEKGASIRTPIPQINELFKFSLPHLEVSDFMRADGSGLIHVPTGTSTYKDYPKETVLMTHSLDERGLHEEARRRLDIWLKYQSTKEIPGMFTDFVGMFFGSGGFEGMGYNQHHGWILWGLAEHLFLTGDMAWYKSIATQAIKGVDWVVRQRRNTMKKLPHSRGWEYGFLPAGALEDIEDYNYWLSTNVLTWRGVNRTALALAEINHPEAGRVKDEAEAFKADLIRGLEMQRRYTPVVRLRDGRWVPNYSSRIYRRGRDVGWTREAYEGSMFLLITELYDPNGREAEWILNDYQDNRYTRPPYSYLTPDFENNWFSRTGCCPEPNFFPDGLPYLERDEAEIYMWRVFNAWNTVWEEELCGMTEHPAPFLGFHNLAMFKTSEEIPALTWVQYMFVYAGNGILHFGKALPREWLEDGNEIHAKGISTYYGDVGISYTSNHLAGMISAKVDLKIRKTPGKILIRFRHPEKALIKSAAVNGKPHTLFDAVSGDVDITGLDGRVLVEVTYDYL